jgi:hypothetical protein
MKKKLHQILVATAIIIASFGTSKAQTISDFENLTLAKTDTFWNGAPNSGMNTFTSGNAILINNYYSMGGYSNGFSYSNKKDSTKSGYMNQYAAKAFHGCNNSSNYAVAYMDEYNNVYPTIKLTGSAAGKVVSGFYVTNATYAHNSMRDGDGWARKFGDTIGTHSGLAQGSQPDWYKLVVKKWLGGVKTNDSVEFYLADFRFPSNSQDYIVKDWRWVDLTTLGNVDSLIFILKSSDADMSGMKTPSYFCMDNFTTADVLLNVANGLDNKVNVQLYPNPANHQITINAKINTLNAATVSVYNTLGALVLTSKMSTETSDISISNLPNGNYTIVIENGNFRAQNSFIKQ